MRSRLLRLWLPSAGALCALGAGVCASLAPLTSFDVLFHIASGRWILAHGFPAADPFSATASHAWFPHQWGYSVLAAWSEQWMGGAGPAWLAGLVLAGGILLLWHTLVRAAGRGGLVGLLCLFLALLAQAHTWDAQRGHQVGTLLFIAVAAICMHHRQAQRGWWGVWLLVPLCALWANVHGSWLAGPALAGCVGVGMLIDGRRSARRAPALVLCGAAALAVLAAALSPEGLRTCVYPLRFVTAGRGGGIMEWHPMDPANPNAQAVLLLTLILGAVLVRGPRRPVALVLPAAGLVAASVLAERFTPMAGAWLAVGVAALLPHGSRQEAGRLGAALQRVDDRLAAYHQRASGWLWPLGGLVLVAGVALTAPPPLAARLHPALFPVEPLRALCRLPPGRVLNTYRFGGAVSALCGPGHKVFIDGRNDVFPSRVHRAYRRVVLCEPGWREVIEAYDPDYLLWSRVLWGPKLLEALGVEGGWRSVVEDQVGVLWVRKRDDDH